VERTATGKFADFGERVDRRPELKTCRQTDGMNIHRPQTSASFRFAEPNFKDFKMALTQKRQATSPCNGIYF
jgi:hypothetical protein